MSICCILAPATARLMQLWSPALTLSMLWSDCLVAELVLHKMHRSQIFTPPARRCRGRWHGALVCLRREMHPGLLRIARRELHHVHNQRFGKGIHESPRPIRWPAIRFDFCSLQSRWRSCGSHGVCRAQQPQNDGSVPSFFFSA